VVRLGVRVPVTPRRHGGHARTATKETDVLDALTLLDDDWETYKTSRAGIVALRRWRAAGVIPPLGNLEQLLAAMQDRSDPDARDELVYRLAVLSRHDSDACRVVLQTVRPGLNGVAQMYHARWGWEDTASMTVTAALDRIISYPPARRSRPAANIVRDVQHQLYRRRVRDVALEATLGQPLSAEDPECAATTPPPSAAAELVDVVQHALSTRRLTHEEASLILRQRILDVPTDKLATERGHKPGTVRRHRRRAEKRLTLITRTTYGLHPAVA
jgi:DNA-directed RNA polymerase specialized sigma24 family protein